MERRGIEVCAVRPHERMNLGIQPHLCEEIRILQRTVQLAGQNRPEIDRLPRAVGELDAQGMGADPIERNDAMERVRAHAPIVAAQSATSAGPGCSRSRCARVPAAAASTP